ncbi:hypothetical protein C8F04DRAFT_1064076 [Mycena alexandri]|uniref:Uncharacterized protein n=1 Tax=Mycena alexandri TaxID=1745969 RepID=A0AAD6TM57_9AGAR|nr:hypothetical protein C8F04DRAFT_1064076 [Mycena alexandri]
MNTRLGSPLFALCFSVTPGTHGFLGLKHGLQTCLWFCPILQRTKKWMQHGCSDRKLLWKIVYVCFLFSAGTGEQFLGAKEMGNTKNFGVSA